MTSRAGLRGCWLYFSWRVIAGSCVGRAAGFDHRSKNFHIAGTAAEIAGEARADLGFGRVTIAREKVNRGKNHSGSADAALCAAVREKRLLHGVKMAGRCDAFDRSNVCTI